MNDIYILLVLLIGRAIAHIGQYLSALDIYHQSTEVMHLETLVVSVVLGYHLLHALLQVIIYGGDLSLVRSSTSNALYKMRGYIGQLMRSLHQRLLKGEFVGGFIYGMIFEELL